MPPINVLLDCTDVGFSLIFNCLKIKFAQKLYCTYVSAKVDVLCYRIFMVVCVVPMVSCLVNVDTTMATHLGTIVKRFEYVCFVCLGTFACAFMYVGHNKTTPIVGCTSRSSHVDALTKKQNS